VLAREARGRSKMTGGERQSDEAFSGELRKAGKRLGALRKVDLTAA
jgi:hypothetical protein